MIFFFRRTCFFIGLMFLALALRAQYVNIPDPNFRAFLQNHYPSCMSGGMLDTTCSDIITLQTIDLSDIGDITGIQYFDSLKVLSCENSLFPGPCIRYSRTQLVALPQLPPSLISLDCSYNNITTISSLPSSLVHLDCSHNNIDSIPPLPLSLMYLDCGYNQISILPSLPLSLTYLDCWDNQLSTLPSLPLSLTYLNCGYNSISMLPSLPPLTSLNCSSNQLSTLPSLPLSLTYLDCSSNQLSALPSLPLSLTYLNCEDNELAVLPTLPPFLKLIHCQHNQLTNLGVLPQSLSNFQCNNNQIVDLPSIPDSVYNLDCSYNQLSSLPSLPPLLEILYCSHNQLRCLPLLPNSLVLLNATANYLTCLPNIPVITTYNSYGGFSSDIGKVVCADFNATDSSTIGSITGPTNVCPNSTNEYTVTLQKDEEVSYNWTLPSGWVGSSSTNSITITEGSLSDTIKVKATNACGISASSSQVIEVYSPAVKTVSVQNQTILSNQEGALSYQWIDCANNNAPVFGAHGQSYTATESGDYAVVIWTESCAPDTSVCTHLRLTQNKVAVENSQIIVYPNPAKDIVTIAASIQETGVIQLRNAEGSLLRTEEEVDLSQDVSLDLSNEPKGLYLIQLITSKGITTEKLILN